MTSYFDCPHCGAEVPQGALACPACGSDEQTGWSDAAVYGELPPGDEELEDETPTWESWTRIVIAAFVALVLIGVFTRSLPGAIALGIPLLAVGIGLALWRGRRRQGRSGGSEAQLYRSLLRMAMGDEALVERLILYEAERSLSADRRRHIQDAIDRWLRDSR